MTGRPSQSTSTNDVPLVDRQAQGLEHLVGFRALDGDDAVVAVEVLDGDALRRGGREQLHDLGRVGRIGDEEDVVLAPQVLNQVVDDPPVSGAASCIAPCPARSGPGRWWGRVDEVPARAETRALPGAGRPKMPTRSRTAVCSATTHRDTRSACPTRRESAIFAPVLTCRSWIGEVSCVAMSPNLSRPCSLVPGQASPKEHTRADA